MTKYHECGKFIVLFTLHSGYTSITHSMSIPAYFARKVVEQSDAQFPTARTSEAKDCSQNANLHRPLVDMGMLEKS
jgi:hypothetical protein